MVGENSGGNNTNEDDDPFAEIASPVIPPAAIGGAVKDNPPTQPSPHQTGSPGNPIHISDPVLDKWTRSIVTWTRALVGVGVVTVAVAYFQWCEMQKDSAQYARTNRAFVYASDLTMIPHKTADGNLDYWRVTLFLENAGNTSTERMKWAIDPRYGPSVDPESTEVDIPFSAANEGFLGPRARFAFFDLLIPRTGELKIMRGSPLFILGQVTYWDTIARECHTTKFCFQVYGPAWKAGLPESAETALINGIDLSANMCHRNNWAHDECEKPAPAEK